MANPNLKFNRVLLKMSGEVLMGDREYGIDPATIERIEVVRGPRSSLYGSEAMGGVIQIFTRRGGADGVKPYFSVGAGSRSSFTGSAGVAVTQGNGWFNLGVSSESTDGINARAFRSSAPDAYEPDADG